jgi:hypothetical protein
MEKPAGDPLLIAAAMPHYFAAVGRICFLSLVATFCGRGTAAGETPVSVRTRDGRTLSGVVDARTGDRSLWVRGQADGILLTTAVAWNDVVALKIAGQAAGVLELRKHSAEFASPEPRLDADPVASVTTVGVEPAHPSTPARAPQMRNLEVVSAHLVNLDRDVEPDGIEVCIAAIGDDGAPMPVAGSFTASLFAERRPALHSVDQFGELDRWTQPVEPRDFVDGVATYQLRFRNTGPEWQFDLLPDAVLNVQLGANGQGQYAASTPVFLRPFNPLRDNLQQQAETRFFRGELHGRDPRQRLDVENGRWQHWTR